MLGVEWWLLMVADKVFGDGNLELRRRIKRRQPRCKAAGRVCKARDAPGKWALWRDPCLLTQSLQRPAVILEAPGAPATAKTVIVVFLRTP
jgi:hypothetical protein